MKTPHFPGLGKPEVPDCPMCGTPFVRTLVRFDFEGEFFGYFPADVCRKGHDFLTGESDRAIEAIAAARGVHRRRARSKAKARAA